MNITQITNNLESLLSKLKDTESSSEFIYDLLLAYNIPNASIARLKKGGLNQSTIEGEIAWKTKLFYKTILTTEPIHEIINELKVDKRVLKHHPRFIIVTDFVRLLAWDTKMAEMLDIPVAQLVQHYDFFLPWAGMEKATHQYENPADVKAAEKMAKLYDEIKKDNTTNSKEEVHNLNVFLSRLLFCFFAEDTGIFEKSQFTHDIKDHTQEDGHDLHTYLDRLFSIMNAPTREDSLPKHLREFPYVNGGLFRNQHHAPVFSRRSRQMLIECGELDWAAINPDIFGSMIQAVITPEHRGGMGMHYTSVPNIMKVIEPLFLDNLLEEFEKHKGNIKKINDLLKRLWSIKIFDPACGSGNFLIIAYKKMRELEMEIFKEIDRINQTFSNQFTGISLDNFYGIELDDFAHEIAILSLWLAEHQMNQAFFNEFGRTRPALPLKETGNIVHGNATRLDWEVVCPKKENDEIYILGNPPYLGARVLDNVQKQDMKLVFDGKIEGYNDLDYIACWFYKGAEFIRGNIAQCAFVSTNSICQGSQVPNLWSNILINGIEIGFVHKSFKWTNNAKSNAAVIVIILGIRNTSNKPKSIFENAFQKTVKNISPYLIPSENTYVHGRRDSLSVLPAMNFGSMPNDGGHFTLNFEEYNLAIAQNPDSKFLIKKFMGSQEFINDIPRWCIWIEDEEELEEALSFDFIKDRIEKVKEHRLSSERQATKILANFPHKFAEVRYKRSESIIIPRHSSERRNYIPIGFLTPEAIIADSALGVYDAKPWHFSVITSRIHMTWIRAVAGRLKSDYRYSASLCYNTFPFPPISDAQKDELKKHVFNILAEREEHSEKTLAQLYDPDKMPEGLREAHRQNDLAVERCYRSKPFESDEERLEYLFKLYEKMIEEEKTKGTLFEMEGKGKKKKK